MSVDIETEKKLGPVDLGKPGKWWHWLNVATGITLCGLSLPNVKLANGAPAGHRLCPDCKRIYDNMRSL